MSAIERFRRLIFGGLAFAIVSAAPATAQSSSDWAAHTSYQSVQAVGRLGDTIWAATSGGVFSFDAASGDMSRYSVVDGLHSVETSTLAGDDDRGVLWIGYPDGVIDRLDPATGAVSTYRDIERATQFASRSVNRIVVRGDSILVATSFGVVIFDPVRNEVRDSFTRLGAFSPAIPVYDVLVAPGDDGTQHLWAATSEGVATVPLASSNLQDPASWSTETGSITAADAEVRSLAFFEGEVYAGNTIDLYVRRSGGTYDRKFVSSSGVFDLEVGAGSLYGSERFNVVAVSAGGAARVLDIPDYQDPTGLAVGPAGGLWVGDRVGGLLDTIDPGSGATAVSINRTVRPSGPSANQFVDLEIAEDGTLWAGASAAAGSGFHRLAPGGEWTNYSASITPELAGAARFTRVSASAAGGVFVGSAGDGVVQVDPNGTVVRYGITNSSLLPASGTGDFIIVGGVDEDSDGTLWVTTRGSSQPLHVRTADGQWTGLPPYVGDGLTSRATAFGRVFVDSFDQKWIILRDESNFNRIRGLMVVDSGNAPADPSGHSFQFFGVQGAAGQGLPSVAVSSVAEDRDGLVWIGTDRGIAYFVNSGVVARDPSARAIWPPWADRSQGTFVLFGLAVNDLAVDPANRLWVATNEGAWLIESVESGYALVEHFTTDDSPLFSDAVLSIAVNPADGRVFFATDQGLLSYQGDAVAPVGEAGDLFIYPNPYRPLDGHQQVTIEGLVESADVRILTPAGSLIATFSSRGGRVTWDGLDRSGQPVSSGVYLVVAVGSDGQGAAYGRLAVIR